MSFLKRLFALAVVVAAAWGALWAWQSPYFAMWQINAGFAAHDAVRVER